MKSVAARIGTMTDEEITSDGASDGSEIDLGEMTAKVSIARV
jgi:hypothetical protein